MPKAKFAARGKPKLKSIRSKKVVKGERKAKRSGAWRRGERGIPKIQLGTWGLLRHPHTRT
jgi:hypothetical protein